MIDDISNLMTANLFFLNVLGSIHTISYNLYGLQPASIYEVAALARNRFGWSGKMRLFVVVYFLMYLLCFLDNSKIIRFATGGDGEFYIN